MRGVVEDEARGGVDRHGSGVSRRIGHLASVELERLKLVLGSSHLDEQSYGPCVSMCRSKNTSNASPKISCAHLLWGRQIGMKGEVEDEWWLQCHLEGQESQHARRKMVGTRVVGW